VNNSDKTKGSITYSNQTKEKKKKKSILEKMLAIVKVKHRFISHTDSMAFSVKTESVS
jgi:hypothetical protein